VRSVGVAKVLGLVAQTLFNWVKASRQRQLKGADSKPTSGQTSTLKTALP
jgi:transposase